jgi:hypothetical protein
VHRRALAIAFALLASACAGVKMPATEPVTAVPAAPAPAASVAELTPAIEQQAIQHIDRMRTILPRGDAKQAALYNKQLEDAWKFFIANPQVIAVIRRSLAREMTQRLRNDFILLDLGYYLYDRGTPADKELAKTALFALDPKAEIVRYNWQELFLFTQLVAASRDARVLAFIDKAFLNEPAAVRFPEADLTLDQGTTCAFLYGAYGDGAEAHLKAMLKTPVTDKSLARKLLEVLTWIGSPAANAEVKGVLMGASRDYETFMRTATFLMGAGGPQGRAVVLAVQPDGLDVWTRSYYEKIGGPARALTYRTLRESLAATPASKAILDSNKPKAELMAGLAAERLALFRAPPTKPKLAEIQRVNATLNALRYRDD